MSPRGGGGGEEGEKIKLLDTTSGGTTVVEHLSHHSKVQGSNPAAGRVKTANNVSLDTDTC